MSNQNNTGCHNDNYLNNKSINHLIADIDREVNKRTISKKENRKKVKGIRLEVLFNDIVELSISKKENK